jgi:hypothetical protein
MGTTMKISGRIVTWEDLTELGSQPLPSIDRSSHSPPQTNTEEVAPSPSPPAPLPSPVVPPYHVELGD